jgi:hypothetical protein
MRVLAIACATVCALVGPVAAEPTYVQPPAGWTRKDEQARSLAAKVNAVKHFGGAKSLATSLVYTAPVGYVAFLYITAVAGEVTEHREAAARVEVDSFLAAPARANMLAEDNPTTMIDETSSAVDPAAKAIEATLEWHDSSFGLVTEARLIVVADATHLYAVSAECSHGELPGEHTDACLAALATLDPGVPLAARVPISLAPPGTEPPPPPAPAHGTSAPPTMSDGPRAPLPPLVVPGATKRTTDRRPVYLGLGIVVLAALFWWNQRRRDRLEKEESDDDR